MYFIDPIDAEFKETSKNARKKLEVAMPASMPCKIRRSKYGETCGSSGIRKTKYASTVEADESTSKRLGGTLQKYDEDHIAGQGINSLNHFKLVHKFIFMPQATKIPDTKAAVEKEWETREKTSMAADESQKPKRGDQ